MMAALLVGTPELNVAARRNGPCPLRDARASREAISLRTLLRAQSLRGHNGTGRPPHGPSGIRDVGDGSDSGPYSHFSERRLRLMSPESSCLTGVKP